MKISRLPALGTRSRVAVALIATLLLAACSPAPDAGDVQPLLEAQLHRSLENAQSAMRVLGGESGVEFMHAMGAPAPDEVSVENVEILESREMEHGDYELQLRYEIVAGDDQRRIETTTVRVNEADNGWRLLPD